MASALREAARARRAEPASRKSAATPAFDRRALGVRLAAGLDALDQPAALAEPLLDYLGLLLKWNAVYNLTAVRDPAQMLVQHLLDSLSIATPLAQRLPARGGQTTARVVDVGSGAGLPGIVLALAWPRADFLLVEPVGKKAAFLSQCRTELGLTHVTVAATRVEQLGEAERAPAPDLIVCRAFASLADFARSIDRLAGLRTLVAAMKGVRPAQEIAALPAGWALDEAIRLEVPELRAERHLVLLRRAAAAAAPPAAGGAERSPD